MLKALKRLELTQRGFSSGKTRLGMSDSQLKEFLRYNRVLRVSILISFAVGLQFLFLYPLKNYVFNFESARVLLVALIIFVTALIQFFVSHKESFLRNAYVTLIFGVIFFQLGLIKLLAIFIEQSQFGESFRYLASPYAFAPIVISILLGRNYGIYVAFFTSLWGCLLIDTANPLLYLIVSLICGYVGVCMVHQVRKRQQIIRAGMFVGLTNLFLAVILGEIGLFQFLWGEVPDFQLIWVQVLVVMGNALLIAIVISGFLPVLESLFRITTDISWIELADLNHPLLQEMTLEAPGTYHHSLVVANLSEAAAKSIGANPIKTRVCSYFHDIGKLKKPNYFIENIGERENPHDELTPSMCAIIIISHVKEGVDLALKNNLNEEIVDIIKEHHGTSLVSYFYHKAKKLQEEVREQVKLGKAHEEDIPEVDEKSFRYPGPKPRSMESGIISLADAVESASRTLQKMTPQKIDALIEEIISSRLKDGQLDECDLTMAHINKIKKSFMKTLSGMLHHRITYPEKEDQAQKNV